MFCYSQIIFQFFMWKIATAFDTIWIIKFYIRFWITYRTKNRVTQWLVFLNCLFSYFDQYLNFNHKWYSTIDTSVSSRTCFFFFCCCYFRSRCIIFSPSSSNQMSVCTIFFLWFHSNKYLLAWFLNSFRQSNEIANWFQITLHTQTWLP